MTPVAAASCSTSGRGPMRAIAITAMAAALGAAAMLMSAHAALALEAVTVTKLAEKTSTASGQPIVLPQKDVRIIVSSFDIAPGARLPVHKHPYARYAVVQNGTLEVVNTQTDTATVYKAGDFIVEMIDEWHRARNVGPDAVKLLVIDQVEGAANNTVLAP